MLLEHPEIDVNAANKVIWQYQAVPYHSASSMTVIILKLCQKAVKMYVNFVLQVLA